MGRIKTIILIIILASALFFVFNKYFLGGKEPIYETAIVERSDIFQEVSVTGQVKKGEEIVLSFESSGKIEKIYVTSGEEVEEGQVLAKLETTELSIQVEEARAALEAAQAKLDNLIAGAGQEEIQVAQTEVENAEVSLSLAQKNLDDAYQDSLNVVESCYLEAKEAKDTVTSIYRSDVELANLIKDNRAAVETAVSQLESSYQTAKTEATNKNIEKALCRAEASLKEIGEELSKIQEKVEDPPYYYLISSTDRTALDTQRTSVNTTLTSLTDTQQNISSLELTLSSVQGQLQLAKDKLALVLAEPQEEELNLYRAQVRQAQAEIELLENQITKSTLKSPVAGQVTKVRKRLGETVQPMTHDPVISLVPREPFQTEVDIPEVDIGKIDIEDLCKITLDAFPETEFSGKVVDIDPAETIIEGVVYYRVRTSLESEEEKIKPGMTANVLIVSESKENVLVIPSRAVIEKEGKKFVRIPQDGGIEEREVQTGLKGSQGEIEIISGLAEGDTVITFVKEK